jgi:hypothetical protein
LAVFGCSWAQGVGVIPADSFGAKLANLLNSTEYINYGIQGSSNSRSVLQLLKHISTPNVENSTAVFLVTTDARDCYIPNNGAIIDLGANFSSEQEQLKYLAQMSPRQLSFNLHRNILSMQTICRAYSIDDYYIVGWSDLDLDLPGIDSNKIYPKSCAQLFGYSGQYDYLNTPPNQYVDDKFHPSAQGHDAIAQTLYTWISKNQQSLKNP